MANAMGMALKPKMEKKMTFQNYLTGEAVVNQITKYIPNNQERKIFITALSSSVAENPNLADCDYKSLMSAGLKCVSMGFLPGGETGDAFLVPFGKEDKKCTVMIGYRGLVRFALRSGKIRCLNMGMTREGQTVVMNYLTGEVDIQGAPISPDAPVTGYFAYMRLSDGGFEKTIYRTKPEAVLHAAAYAKSSFDPKLYAKYEAYLKTGEGLTDEEKKECQKIYYQNFDKMSMKNCLRNLLLNWAPLTTYEREVISSDGNTGTGIDDEDTETIMDMDGEVEAVSGDHERGNETKESPETKETGATETAKARQSRKPQPTEQPASVTAQNAADDFFGR